eukprot:8432102-Alexandrium_andersonii.AAC.1
MPKEFSRMVTLGGFLVVASHSRSFPKFSPSVTSKGLFVQRLGLSPLKGPQGKPATAMSMLSVSKALHGEPKQQHLAEVHSQGWSGFRTLMSRKKWSGLWWRLKKDSALGSQSTPQTILTLPSPTNALSACAQAPVPQ